MKKIGHVSILNFAQERDVLLTCEAKLLENAVALQGRTLP
jgi:hypothetical protein